MDKVLIASTTAWAWPARLAMEFRSLGAQVSAIGPANGPLAAVRDIWPHLTYAAAALNVALMTEPDIVIPCDDRAVADLHELHRDVPMFRPLIERSLGDPFEYAAARERGMSMHYAATADILEPRTVDLQSDMSTNSWARKRKFPLVLKADGTWGGNGVAIAHDQAEAVAAFKRLNKPRGWRRERAAVVGQDFVQGHQANVMAACWQGEVLASVCVEVVETAKDRGVATIIKPINGATMKVAAERLVRRLGMSGFCGLDFVIEEGTQRAFMIELNPRPTQIGHLPLLPDGGTLAGALLARVRGHAIKPLMPRIQQEHVALFPNAWMADAASPRLLNAYRDIPWQEPTLLAFLIRRLGDNRGKLPRLIDRALGRRTPARLMAEFVQSQENLRGTRSDPTKTNGVNHIFA